MNNKKKYFLDVCQSALGQAWFDKLDTIGANQALSMAQKYNIPLVLARILTARNIDENNVLQYLEPTIKNLMPNPLNFKDMDKAALRISDAIKKRETIAIFGDYDVDGACSAAILSRFFSFFGLESRIYIPDRIVEGYGPNPSAMKMLIEEGAQLIITVDCGANSLEAIKAAREAGGDVVILDHHQMDDIHNEAVALVNPNRPDDVSAHGHLCAAGVVFITIAWINKLLRETKQFKVLPDILEYLDMVALATICDVVPLQGVNRAFVTKGLQVARKLNNYGFAALAQVSHLAEPLNNFHLGFLFGPRINAGGRIGDPALGAKLLTSSSKEIAYSLAETLNRLNQERQNMEADQLVQAESDVAAMTLENQNTRLIIVNHKDWHPGIIGIMAARLKERYHCPVFVIASKPDGTAVGSGRSIEGVDLGQLVREAVQAKLLVKGGGHAMAAGITIKEEKISDFRSWLEKKISDRVGALQMKKCLEIDGIISASGVTKEFVETIQQAGPFGSGNTTPIFALPSHKLISLQVVGNGHLKMIFSNVEGKKINGIAFRALQTPLGDFLQNNINQTLHCAGTLTLNYWRGSVFPQIRIVDVASPY
ncbi:single-stranded-DNA-specific exonuclease RecJ [Bartonella tamiae]|uniref:Single-stranded-DNA-specific exonuclease RecJ n=1 Tax=Bartonella tamiae Th239 TaxID=1094558 RepID=J0QZM4_9HYPH|nr:single-stranded-DNA-specific exonuclease RecJ [Bartonella tamiae]EJF88699.1 single-stranded-DNA-specific exonuclease RecJ [Bartonella tamiae Th239]EJF95051.1 single-stranded-DNA-specific exonuclease RecJ [Bartonella tamiae Th307]